MATAIIAMALFLSRAGHARADETVAFVNVNVIPMNGELLLEDHTVLVENGLISMIGPSTATPVPDGATIIDGAGAFLIPGLADMHTHLDVHDTDPRQLLLYLAHGITTVRSFDGTSLNLEWRKGTSDGTLEGPTILTNGPVLMGLSGRERGRDRIVRLFRIAVTLFPLAIGISVWLLLVLIDRVDARRGRARRIRGIFRVPVLAGSTAALLLIGLALSHFRVIPFMTVGRYVIMPHYFVAENGSQARAQVRSLKESGYDFIKMYDFIDKETYLSAVDEANRIGIYVTGHLPDQVPLETVATSGQAELGHVSELQSHFWFGYGDSDENRRGTRKKEYPYDYTIMDETVRLLRDNDISAVSTIVEKEIICRLIEDTGTVLDGDEYRLVPPGLVEMWRTQGRNVTSCRNEGPWRRNEMMPFLTELTLALHEGDVMLTLGGAVSNEGVIPGYHYIHQFEILAEAGFAPYDLLEMATKNAGVIVDRMDRDGNFGTIEKGRRADLLLLAGNPLDDISNIGDQIGVMARGRWFTREELDRGVERLVEDYRIE